MPIILILFLVIGLGFSSTGQKGKDQPAPERSQEPASSIRQTAELPISKRVFRPKISLQEGLKLAETYIAKERIDSSSYYLLEVRMIQYGGEKGPKESRWFFWWVHENGRIGDYIQITVSMDGKVARHPSM